MCARASTTYSYRGWQYIMSPFDGCCRSLGRSVLPPPSSAFTLFVCPQKGPFTLLLRTYEGRSRASQPTTADFFYGRRREGKGSATSPRRRFFNHYFSCYLRGRERGMAGRFPLPSKLQHYFVPISFHLGTPQTRLLWDHGGRNRCQLLWWLIQKEADRPAIILSLPPPPIAFEVGCGLGMRSAVSFFSYQWWWAASRPRPRHD